MKLVLFVLLSFCSIEVLAWESKSSYDYNTGNSYHTSTDDRGNTEVRGINLNTGSMWNTHIRNNGDMNGMDSRGNNWNYDKSSNVYMNYGTGKICTGSGYGRICSGGD